MNYTEKDIQLALWRKFINSVAVVPNAMFYHWESDLLVVSRSMYVTEYEIKISVSDFRADAKKERAELIQMEYYRPGWDFGGDPIKVGRPNRFYYVMPEDIAFKITVPDWAGLMVLRKPRYLSEVKRPKRLHNEKIEHEQVTNLIRKMQYRFWKQFTTVQEADFKRRNPPKRSTE